MDEFTKLLKIKQKYQEIKLLSNYSVWKGFNQEEINHIRTAFLQPACLDDYIKLARKPEHADYIWFICEELHIGVGECDTKEKIENAVQKAHEEKWEHVKKGSCGDWYLIEEVYSDKEDLVISSYMYEAEYDGEEYHYDYAKDHSTLW